MEGARVARGRSAVVLAIDVGTSSCRASLYDPRGRRRPGAAGVAYAPRTTADGGAELDAEWLFEQLCAVIDPLAGRAALGPVLAVGMATFWHSLLGLDRAGRAATPVYLWLDARSRADAAALRADGLDERAVHARTGCVLHWSYWPAKLRWLRRARPELCRGVERWVSFGEYARLRLCGELGASISMASGTGLLDEHTCDWDGALLAALSVAREQLAPLVPLAAGARPLRPEFARRWPALRGVPWLPAVGDGACSNLGAGCATRERFALMIGTSGVERVVWRPGAGGFRIPWGTWCYRVDRQRLVLGGALNDGGSLLGWLRRALRLPPPRLAERAVAAQPPDGHGLTVLPFWAGERSPGWALDARGAVLGLRLHTGPAEILRAALEAVALRFAELDAILRRAVPEGREVVGTGGALLHSPAWLQILADVLGRPIAASAEPQASSRGAALLALEALGRLAEPLEAQRPVARRVYEPIAAHTERYLAAAERQRRLYDLLVG